MLYAAASPPLLLQPFSAARLRLAAATGLAAASVQAKLLADQEEREVQRLVLAAIEHQFKKVNAKLQVGAPWGCADACAECAVCSTAAMALDCYFAWFACLSLNCSTLLPCPSTRIPFLLPACPSASTPCHLPPARLPTLLQYLEELDGVMGSERLSLEAMRGKFVDEYAKAVADNVAAGLGPPPGRQAAAQQQQQQPAGSQQQAAPAAAGSAR